MAKDKYIDGLRLDLAELRSLVEQLESGRLMIGDGPSGANAQERTRAYVEHLKRTIGNLDAIIDRHDA